MKHLLLPSLLLAAGVGHAQATFSIGPVVGGNLTTAHSNADTDFRYRLNWLAGAQIEARWGKVAVQPALLFSQKGYQEVKTVQRRDINNLPMGTVDFHDNVRLGYLTLPVNVVYAPHGSSAGPQVFAGPYVSMLLSTRSVYTDLSDPTTVGEITDHPPIVEKVETGLIEHGFRRLDAGLQGGLGYRYAAFQLQASYSLGLRNTSPASFLLGTPLVVPNVYNRSFQLALAYLFTKAH